MREKQWTWLPRPEGVSVTGVEIEVKENGTVKGIAGELTNGTWEVHCEIEEGDGDDGFPSYFGSVQEVVDWLTCTDGTATANAERLDRLREQAKPKIEVDPEFRKALVLGFATSPN